MAREAIASLRLTPVLFEQGARPHVPRDLYTAYVDQCDVFVGIYWQSYGWVAPGGAVSGLEDEYELARGKPKLLYIKEPAFDREERLRVLIRRIEDEAGPAYRTFSTVEELGRIVRDDLALLLTERFHASTDERDQRSELPARTTSFVGRDHEVNEVSRLVERSDVRLVTLTGPGGIGKTRLAVEAARRLAPRFREGAAYVALDRVADPELVPAAVADAVGLPSLGPDPVDALARRLRERHLLLVVDNFEHVLAAAPLLTQLLEACEQLEVLATSREPLRLQGEHEYSVPPLEAAPTLFMERVAAMRPDVVWNEENVRAAGEICAQVDHLPLAVELVAGAARLFSPSVLVEHIESSLDAPSTGRRDAPARQQTVRATIDWSYGLLNEDERDLFERLGVFAGSFTIEAAGSVAGEQALAVLSTLSALVDKSLLVHAASESETRFRMLRVVAEYAAERLCDRADAEDISVAHAEYYADLARAAYSGLRGSEQRGWKDTLDFERENIRRAVGHLARTGRVDEAADLVWSVWVYWLTGHVLEGRKLAGDLLALTRELSERGRARLQTVEGVLAGLLSDIGTAQAALGQATAWFEEHDDNEGKASALAGLALATAPVDPERARSLMLESASLFAGIGDAWGEAIVLGSLGWLDTGRGDFSEERLFERAYALARHVDDEVATAHTATNLAELRLASGQADEARDALDTALTALEAVRLYDGLSYSLEATARLAKSDNRSHEAARLLGAADGLREEVGMPIWGPRLSRFEALAQTVRSDVGEASFAARWAEGRTLSFDAALATARDILHGAEADVRS